MERLRRALRKFSVSFARRIKRRAGLQAKSKRGLEPRVGHRSTTDIPPSADKNPSRRLNLFPRAWCRKRGGGNLRSSERTRKTEECPSVFPSLPSSRFERSNDTKSPRRVTGHASSNEAIKRNEKEKRSEEEEEEEERRECAREIRNRRF